MMLYMDGHYDVFLLPERAFLRLISISYVQALGEIEKNGIGRFYRFRAINRTRERERERERMFVVFSAAALCRSAITDKTERTRE
jgi:hypothetical protein